MTPVADNENRSRVMAAVKSSGNRSTEWRLRAMLARGGIRGWRIQDQALPGKPDFVFHGQHVILFVDGCFWHGCPRCYRRPHSSRKYWDAKVRKNILRDRRIRAGLRREGWSVLRIWEHELKVPERVLQRIRRAINL